MRIALVHDYIKEFGGAERMLEALCEIFPDAPIYTAFCLKDSTAGRAFANRQIISSWGNWLLPKFHLYSVLRFLTPLIWESFNFDGYDLVISSSSWYITKGIKVKKPTIHICYCHTPPRWLYGYTTPIEWKKFWPIRLYGEIVGHFLRQYDYQTSQKVDYFIANSQEVAGRIKKFYRRESTVIYPPVEVNATVADAVGSLPLAHRQFSAVQNLTQDSLRSFRSSKIGERAAALSKNYFLVVSRLEGAKKIDLAIRACNQLKENLWIVGSGSQEEYLKSIAGPTVKFLGRVEDDGLWKVYKNCKALICTAIDEDFGITPVEAMAAGRPVIAFRGGGYLETVVERVTGVFYDEPTVESLCGGIKRLGDLGKLGDLGENCRKQAEKFGKERFKKEITEFVKKYAGTAGS